MLNFIVHEINVYFLSLRGIALLVSELTHPLRAILDIGSFLVRKFFRVVGLNKAIAKLEKYLSKAITQKLSKFAL